MMPRRRAHLLGCLAIAALALVPPQAARCAPQDLLNDALPFSGATLHLRPYASLASGSENIISMTTRPGDSRLYVTSQEGSVYVLNSSGPGSATPSLWFDVKQGIDAATNRTLFGNAGHEGVQSVAFHPGFSDQASPGYGKFYTTQLETRPSNPAAHRYLGSASCCDSSADSVLSEWTFNHQTGTVDPGSYRDVFRVRLPVRDHMIKQARFNPYAEPGDEDYGLLYVTHGDSSSQQSTENRPQSLDSAVGKMLRINPLATQTAPYSIPSTNPFAADPSSTVLKEVYAYGFRNPHTFSFNRDEQGGVHILVGDIGRSNIEEVNLVVAGGNYGWTKREGTFVHRQTTVNVNNPNNPPPNPDAGYLLGVTALAPNEASVGLDARGNYYTYPVAQWDHNDDDVHVGQDFTATAIATGFVLRNGSDPQLHNQFIHHNFSFNHGDVYQSDMSEILDAVTQLDLFDPARDQPGELTQAAVRRLHLALDHDSNPLTPEQTSDDLNHLLSLFRNDSRYGEGTLGEMYVSTKTGKVYLVTNSVPLPGDYNDDLVVDLADYVVWRDTQNQTGYQLGADGNGDGVVNDQDYNLWSSHFGASWGAAGLSLPASAPEPSPAGLVATAGAGLAALRARRRSL